MSFLFQEIPPVVVKKERGVDRAASRQAPGYRVRAQGNDVESEIYYCKDLFERQNDNNKAHSYLYLS
jgi:hypothetical protein